MTELSECSCSQTCKNENTTAHNNCTCNQKIVSGVAPVIDAEAKQKSALIRSRDEMQDKIFEICQDYESRKTSAIAPLMEAIKRTNQMINVLTRPECFGNLDGHLRKVSGPAQCEACDHVLPCYQAQCERGRC
jgi:hypothetical protein